ncbi:inter-alpha-trypsin inhibitor heavy chain H3-like isoform X2 [Rana temporaria]|uniref:inter-alpha-trypsin inhibitor heavy chain H3-like isoform X2 n=1 Tax=Rana temporaria TaxID=8407 RepID=UPI001AACAE8F|nr:inter-alpha-trypsin inhibitor heavy chain H3-like isoform X2 [Rana temporaria]
MGHLPVAILFFYVLTLIKGDFLIEGLRNIQKRSTTTNVDGIEVYNISIISKVTSRFAHNVITSRAVNHANRSEEAVFDVDLPKTAFITNFTMKIDGVEYPGIIKEKEVARKQYETAVSRGQTAGLVRASSGRKTEKFTVSVNVAAKSKVTFELVYEEMLKRHLGNYKMFIKVQPKTLVKNFQITVDIHEQQGISFLDAKASFITNDLQPAIKKSFAGEKGQISFTPTLNQQRTCAGCTTTLLDGDFTVIYDVNRESPGNIQVVNGYFVHFFAPKLGGECPKMFIYVIDRSSSMSGAKITQTKEALLQMLDDTMEHDYFNFILFSTSTSVWQKNLVKATPGNLAAAREYIRNFHIDWATNINDALMQAVQLLDRAHQLKQVPERSVSLIVLLTDGQANVGESDPARIQENAKRAIQGRYTLYCLGFGYSVDYPFLEKMALENSGVAVRIYEDSDATLQMQGFYNEIANPTLVDIKMQYPENITSNVTQNTFKHYFDGSEIVVAGHITDNNLDSFIANVEAEGTNATVSYSQNVQLKDKDAVTKQQEYIFGDFTERLWAYLTIQQLLEKRVYADSSEKERLKAQALELSLKFKFVTPLTSMVVTKPEQKDEKAQTFVADKFVEGQPGNVYVAQPAPVPNVYVAPIAPAQPIRNYGVRSWVDSDPHFVIADLRKNDALCFNIQEEPGVLLNLIIDQKQGIAVNGELIGDKTTNQSVQSIETYFGKLGIVNKMVNLRIEVTTDAITVIDGDDQTIFSWLDTVTVDKKGFNFAISNTKSVKFSFGEGATFVIVLHKVWEEDPVHRDYLGFYTLNDHAFSEGVHGLLGQFFHGVDYEISDIHSTDDPSKPDATMKVKNKLLTVTRGIQKNYRDGNTDNSEVPCWFVHHNAEGLIDGKATDYIVQDIFSIV